MSNITQRKTTWWQWLDDNILVILSAFLLAFIPLYPKIPLWSPIEQYIVRVRWEDIVILFTTIVYGIQVLRGKARWRSPMFWGVLAYAIVGLLSTLSAMFITKTVPLQPLHIGKTVLHYFRYLEYFSLFFILFGAVKTRKQVVFLASVFAVVVLAVAIYGYGQKYFYWPVYSTMNREFSKGIRLYLTPFARVQSTFGGHYDMAAWLVVASSVVLSLAYQVRQPLRKTALFIIFGLASWLLIMSASRTAFAAGLGGIGMVVLLTGWLKPKVMAKVSFWASRGAVMLLCLGVLFYYFGADLSERLSQVVNANPQLASQVNWLTEQRRHFIDDKTLAQLPLSPAQLQKMLPQTTPPQSGISTDQLAAEAARVAATQDVASSKDQQPIPGSNNQPDSSPLVPPIFQAPDDVPAGVYVEVPETVSVESVNEKGEKVITQVQRRRVYSKCALEKELSLCIRQETLWPRAIEGFLVNPVLGTGYATLTKESVYTFTEADSTDNNYLRTLGETGLLGVLTFYGCVLVVLVIGLKHFRQADMLGRALCIGLVGGTVGLMLNAVYIDVFAASKVAQSYWAISGLMLGYILLPTKVSEPAETLTLAKALEKIDSRSVTSTSKATRKHSSAKTRKR